MPPREPVYTTAAKGTRDIAINVTRIPILRRVCSIPNPMRACAPKAIMAANPFGLKPAADILPVPIDLENPGRPTSIPVAESSVAMEKASKVCRVNFSSCKSVEPSQHRTSSWMNVWNPVMSWPTYSSGMSIPFSTYTEAYPANHHKACGGRWKQTCGYKKQVPKNRRPARRDRDEAPRMASRFTASKGMVDTNNKKAQRTIFGLVLARTRIYITFLGRVEGCIVSRRSPVSVCRITEESCVCGCMPEVLYRHRKRGHTVLLCSYLSHNSKT